MFGKKSFPLAIDIGSYAVKLVQLGSTKSGLVLERLGMASLSPGAVRDGEVCDSEEVMRAIEELVAAERVKERRVAVGLSGPTTVVRTIQLPRLEGYDLEEAVQLEADQHLPYSVDEALLKRRRLRRVEVDGETLDEYLLVAVKKQFLDDMVDLFRHLKFEPKIMDVNLLALESAFELSGIVYDGEPIALVDIGASETLVHIVHRGRTLLTRTIPLGGSSVTQAIQERLDVTRLDAEGIKLGTRTSPSPRAVAEAIRSEVERLARELGRTFQMASKVFPDSNLRRMVLSGGGVHLEGLPAYLAASLDLPTEIAQPFQSVEVSTDTFDPDFVDSLGPIAAVGAGLAYQAVMAE